MKTVRFRFGVESLESRCLMTAGGGRDILIADTGGDRLSPSGGRLTLTFNGQTTMPDGTGIRMDKAIRILYKAQVDY